jgi:hypothetical protein
VAAEAPASHHLRCADVVRRLNSTPLGEVIRPYIVYNHRNRAGYRIAAQGDGERIDLIKYAAWLFHKLHDPAGHDGANEAVYAAHKEQVNARGRAQSESSRDIAADGWVHEPIDPQRKESARLSFRSFCELYFPHVFHLAWSPDHLTVIAKLERAVLEGGLFALAMPRGSGKSSMCETAGLWALLYGHREFVALIGSDEDHAAGMLDSIKSALENSDALEQDFAEVCGPVRALEGIHQRANGQHYRGARTHVSWTAKEIVLPTIAGSPASGGVVRVAGITGRVRGMKFTRAADGRVVRPSLVLLDDPQTDESARSPQQCANREAILSGAILGLAGPGRKIAGLMTLTVVAPGDMADRLLDRAKHPAWQGERMKMLYAMPSDRKLWDKYAALYAKCLREEKGLVEANEFYRLHREQMDAGARVAWGARHHPDELSAVQHAMNLKFRDEAAFYAEYQNEPLVVRQEQDDLLTADQIGAKTNGLRRGAVPHGCDHVTAFIDVQQHALFWMTCAWGQDFTGSVIDYGTYPDQKLSYFTLRDVRRTLSSMAEGTGLEGAIYAGLDALTDQLVGREWVRDGDDASMRAGKLLIDANWGNSTDVVYQFCRQSRHAALLQPSHGRYVGASSIPFDQYATRPGERVGHHWRVPVARGRAVRHVLVDTNYWKSFVQARLGVAMGDRGCLSLFAGSEHRMLADHLTSEYRVRTEGRGRSVDEWRLRTPGRDNHWLDCLVGCAAGASMLGAALAETQARRKPRKVVSVSEIQKRARHWSATRKEWVARQP